ncbi:MAG: ribulokinase [Paracoccaceae bacterium]
MTDFLIGLDFGTASARGVLVSVETGKEVASHVVDYPHGTLTKTLPDGTPLGRSWALQVAGDYLVTAETILSKLGNGRKVAGIGLGFTASSPMPTDATGTPLSDHYPDDPHAYVKLWKHGAAQKQADRINQQGGAYLDRFGGKVSAEWLLAKAAQIAEESPESWSRTARFIEAGDWIVWQLVGSEHRSLGFAAYKAQYDSADGYPENVVDGLADRLSDPHPVGTAAGVLNQSWRDKTGIIGPCAVAVAVIDSHVVLPAIGAVTDGCFVAALGTSAVSMILSKEEYPLPKGIEGAAFDGSIRGLWCYEAGQASFGDTLNWFVQMTPRGKDDAESFAAYNAEAKALKPGESRLLAIDWWNGNRVPHADSGLSGMILGLTLQTDAVAIYRSLVEGLCYGMRQIFDLYIDGGFTVSRVVMSSGLAQRNPFLVQVMADVIGRPIEVPDIDNTTAIGAAIHGAVASQVVPGFKEGAAQFGARSAKTIEPDPAAHALYSELFSAYLRLSKNEDVKRAIQVLNSPI